VVRLSGFYRRPLRFLIPIKKLSDSALLDEKLSIRGC
jgi:hypothetical protein